MRSKRLLIALIVCIVIVGVTVAGSATFVVRHVDVQFMNVPEFIPNVHAATSGARASVSFINGRNALFGIDRERMVEYIERDNNLIRVTNIEMRFPNRLEIRIRERYPVFVYTLDTRTFVFDANLRLITTNPLPGRDLISLNGQLGLQPLDFSGIRVGYDYLDDIIDPYNEYQQLRLDRIRNTAEFFWARGNFEDSLHNLFYSVRFTQMRGPMDMIWTRRNAGGGRSPFTVEIRDIEDYDDFWRKKTHVWDVIEHHLDRLTHFHVVVWINDIGAVVASATPI